MEKIFNIVSVVILNQLLYWFVTCREDLFSLNPKCQQIKELYLNESCAILNIPQHIKTPQTQICTYKFEGLKILRVSLEQIRENCLFDIKLGTGIEDTPVKVIPCQNYGVYYISWPWSAVYLFVNFKENCNGNSNRFINFKLCVSNIEMPNYGNMNKNNGTDSSRNNQNKNNIVKRQSYDETMHKIVSPVAAFLTVGLIACLVFCVRYQEQHGFMRGASSEQSINQTSSEGNNDVDVSEPAYSISGTSDFMNGISPYYYYVYQMNKSLHPFPIEPPPSYSEVTAGQTYLNEDPPPYNIALGMITQHSEMSAET